MQSSRNTKAVARTEPYKLPTWVEKAPKEQRQQLAVRFRLMLAALYATEAGSLRQFSEMLGLNPSTLATYAGGRESIPPATCVKIEKLLGVDLFPRHLLNPEHFESGR